MEDNVRIDRFDNTKRELKGLVNAGQIKFECNECRTPLLVVQQTSVGGIPEANVLTRVAVKCGFCNTGYSPVEQISGRFYPGSPNDDTIFEPIDNNEDAPEADILFVARGK